MSVRDAGEPIIAFASSQDLLAVGGPPVMPATISVDARIARIVQRADRGRCRQRPEDRRRAVAEPRGEEKALFSERLDGLACGSDPRERLEEVGDRLPDLQVWVERYFAGVVIDKASRKHAAILAASYFVQNPPTQPGFDDMEFGLAHRSFEAEQQPIVEAGGIDRGDPAW